jgi:hypothetical protein
MRLSGALAIFGAVFGAAQMLAQSEVMRQVAINDPVLQMSAWTLNVPAKWQAEGTMLPGSSCESATTPVVRASSPDGLTGIYLLPRTDWVWGSVRPGMDCQRLPDVASASDYLSRFVRIRQLDMVRELPVPELGDARRNLESLNQQARGSMHFTVDMARALVRYSIKDRPIEEWLTVTLNCNSKMVMAVGQQNECSAFVSRWFAPAGKLEAKIPEFQAMKMTLNQQWMERWKAAVVQRSMALSGPQTQALLEQGRLAQSQRMKQHQDFMATMQKNGAVRNEQFAQGQYQKQQNKENYVDYILDCQRAYSGNTRVSAGNCANRQTW